MAAPTLLITAQCLIRYIYRMKLIVTAICTAAVTMPFSNKVGAQAATKKHTVTQTDISRSPSKNEEKAIYKAFWIDEFKITYFKYLLRKGYNNSASVWQLLKQDHSGSADPILTQEDYALIDRLTTADNRQMMADSANNSDGKVAEGAEGKHILKYILSKYNSKELDSLAHKRYQYAEPSYNPFK